MAAGFPCTNANKPPSDRSVYGETRALRAPARPRYSHAHALLFLLLDAIMSSPAHKDSCVANRILLARPRWLCRRRGMQPDMSRIYLDSPYVNAFLALGLMPVSSFLYPLKMKSGSRSTNRETGQCADNIVELKKNHS